MRIVKTYMNDPMEIAAEKVQTGADNVTHHYYEAVSYTHLTLPTSDLV